MSRGWSEFAGGWRLVAGSLLGISTGVSSLYFYSLGIFLKPLAMEYGWGRGEASLGALIGTAGAALTAIPMGRVVDRWGSFRVAVGSLLLLALGFVCLGALTSGLVSFLFITGVLSLLTSGSSPLPYTRLIVAAFHDSRGVALGITLAGTGVGALVVPVLLIRFVSIHGWRAGYFVLSGVVIVLMPLIAWLIHPDTEQKSLAQVPSTLSRVVRTADFQYLALTFFLVSMAVLGTLVHFVPMLTDWGLSPTRAGMTAGLIGVATVVGRLLVGALLDHVAPLAVTRAVFLSVALGMISLALGGPGYANAGALVLGLAVGAEVDLIAFLVARYFPKEQYGQIYGALYAVFLAGGAVGPALSGYVRQATGEYRVSLLADAVLLCVAATLTFSIARRPSPSLIDPDEKIHAISSSRD
jgi:MFS family permease